MLLFITSLLLLLLLLSFFLILFSHSFPPSIPVDCVWENISIPSRQISMRRTIADGTLIVGAVFWSIVVVRTVCTHWPGLTWSDRKREACSFLYKYQRNGRFSLTRFAGWRGYAPPTAQGKGERTPHFIFFQLKLKIREVER